MQKKFQKSPSKKKFKRSVLFACSVFMKDAALEKSIAYYQLWNLLLHFFCYRCDRQQAKNNVKHVTFECLNAWLNEDCFMVIRKYHKISEFCSKHNFITNHFWRQPNLFFILTWSGFDTFNIFLVKYLPINFNYCQIIFKFIIIRGNCNILLQIKFKSISLKKLPK